VSLFQRYSLIFLTLAILFPPVAKLFHMYAHDDHPVCSDHNDAHIHKNQLSCELCKFHFAPFSSFTPFTYELTDDFFVEKKFFNNYIFLSEYQKLSFALRGPPQGNSIV